MRKQKICHQVLAEMCRSMGTERLITQDQRDAIDCLFLPLFLLNLHFGRLIYGGTTCLALHL